MGGRCMLLIILYIRRYNKICILHDAVRVFIFRDIYYRSYTIYESIDDSGKSYKNIK